MAIKCQITLFIVFVFSLAASAQDGINYKHRALLKHLSKAGIPDTFMQHTIPVENTDLKRGSYFVLENSPENKYKFLYVGRVNSCRAGGCSISGHTQSPGSSEYFDYFILFDSSKAVRLVKVFNYQASHGHEISVKSWLKQFIGHDGSEPLEVNKNVDAISGATISVYAITADVELRTANLKVIGQ